MIDTTWLGVDEMEIGSAKYLMLEEGESAGCDAYEISPLNSEIINKHISISSFFHQIFQFFLVLLKGILLSRTPPLFAYLYSISNVLSSHTFKVFMWFIVLSLELCLRLNQELQFAWSWREYKTYLQEGRLF